MKSTLSLYGIKPSILKDMMYVDALIEKTRGARNMIARYSTIAFTAFKEKDYDTYALFNRKAMASRKAFDFNQQLLEELDEG